MHSLRRKAFIAAPLVGTLIFLICLLLVVSMGRSESTRVNEVVSRAYHNRLASVVEIYRSDLGSNFNTGLQRIIEYGLTSQCWFNFANLGTETKYADVATAAQTTPNNDVAELQAANALDTVSPAADSLRTVTEAEERYFACRKFNSLMKQVICPVSETTGYGLPAWIDTISGGTSFEGIDLTIQPPYAAEKFTAASNPADPASLNTLCSTMVQDILFDCRSFAERGNPSNPAYANPMSTAAGAAPFQCCSVDNGLSPCPPDKIVPGCGVGAFQVKISVTHPSVYPYLPRIQAADGAGNVIRAGAISDKDFNAPVTYPLFKYLDAAFYFNRHLAYGKNAKRNDFATEPRAFQQGIVLGTCLGASGSGAGCTNPALAAELPGLPAGRDYGPDPVAADANAIEGSLAQQFFNEVVAQSACERTSGEYASGANPSEIEAYFCRDSLNCDNNREGSELVGPDGTLVGFGSGWRPCRGPGSVEAMDATAPDADGEFKRNLFGVGSVQCNSAGDIKYCGFIKSTSPKLLFVDSDDAVQVAPNSPNQFCWYSSVQYLNAPG